MKSWVQSLSGGVVVYVIVAACGSDEVGRRVTEVVDASSSGSTSVGGGGAASSPDASRGGTPAGGASPVGGDGGSQGVPDGALADSGRDAVPGASDGAAGLLDAALDAVANPVAPAQAQSGTRLKAQWYVGEDGAREFKGWWDELHDVECAFKPASDGATRCLPGYAVFPISYSDDQCAFPVFRVPDTEASCLPTFATTAETAAVCGPSTPGALRKIEQEVVLTEIYGGGPGACVGPNGVSATTRFYAVGPALLPADFVSGTVTTD